MKKMFVILFLFARAAYAQQIFTANITINGDALYGKNVYLVLLKDREAIILDSVLVREWNFSFSGTADTDNIYYLRVENRYFAEFIPEAGVVKIEEIPGDSKMILASGTPLNDKLYEYKKVRYENTHINSSATTLRALVREATDDSYEMYLSSFRHQTLEANKDNIIAAYVMSDLVHNYTLAQLDSALNALPYKKALNYSTLRWIYEKKDMELKTRVGQKFVDFEFEDYSGNKVKLSDHVGKGNYVLGYFWQSCNNNLNLIQQLPANLSKKINAVCMAQIPYLKSAYKKYSTDGLVILGLGVWDAKENLEKAIREYELPWIQLYDPNNVDGISLNSMKLYGVGVPNIILFSPDGIITDRNLRDKGIETTLAKIYGKKKNK